MININNKYIYLISLRHSWDSCFWDTTTSGPIFIDDIAVRERTKTINQGRTLRRAASRKPLKLISSHSIFFNLTCSRVTSNQSRTPDHDPRARVRAADPSLVSRADRNSATPPIPFLLYFSYTMRSSLRFADPWLTGYPWHLHAGQSGAPAQRAVTHSGSTVGAATSVRDDSRASKCHCEITFRFDFGDDSERLYDAILKSDAHLIFFTFLNFKYGTDNYYEKYASRRFLYSYWQATDWNY